ncbi:MAG: hypothetical protein PHE55_22070 [Methylococcaceae bacterium]|nr:hypothetical protein [Methylococcaceae bacterium]
MAKHTQGEWGVATIDGGAADDEVVTTVNGCMVNIAAVFGAGEYSEARPDGKDEPHYEVSREESEANAKLIAAAPDLLYALQDMLRRFDCGNNRDYDCIVAARAAIKKAEK